MAGRSAAELSADVSARMRAARVSAGMGLSELSKASGLSRSHLYYIESAKVSPSVETVFRVAEALGVGAKGFFPEG